MTGETRGKPMGAALDRPVRIRPSLQLTEYLSHRVFGIAAREEVRDRSNQQRTHPKCFQFESQVVEFERSLFGEKGQGGRYLDHQRFEQALTLGPLEGLAFFDLLEARERTGMELTESMAMTPASSVSGLYFAHPRAEYFGVGRIGRDQVADYARRKGWDVCAAERWLAPILAYEPE